MIDDIQAAVEAETGHIFVDSPKVYLGDGVYAFHNGHEIILATVREFGSTLHWMALDLSMIRSLGEFIKRAKAKPSEQKEGQ